MAANVGGQALANANQLAKAIAKRPSSQLPARKSVNSPTLEQSTPQMAIVKRNNKDEVVLAPRKVKTKRMERTVLHEDKYLEHLDRIIQRDFYPEIPKLRAQTEYVEVRRPPLLSLFHHDAFHCRRSPLTTRRAFVRSRCSTAQRARRNCVSNHCNERHPRPAPPRQWIAHRMASTRRCCLLGRDHARMWRKRRLARSSMIFHRLVRCA